MLSYQYRNSHNNFTFILSIRYIITIRRPWDRLIFTMESTQLTRRSWYLHTGRSLIPRMLYTSIHYNDVIMSAMASQITSLAIVYSTVYSRHRSKQTSKLRVTGLCMGNSPVTGEFPAQMASNAENVSIWWRHHDTYIGLVSNWQWVII